MSKFTKLYFIHFSYNDFTSENFINKICHHFELKTTYSILIKISSGNNLIFKMCGSQIGISIGKEHDLIYYSKIHNVIKTRIESTVNLYDYIDSVEGIEISYFVINTKEELKLKNISNIPFNKQVISIKNAKKHFNQNILPLTIDNSYYGKLIESYDKLKLIKLINRFTINGFNYQLIESDNIFIYVSPNNKNKYIIVSRKIDDLNFLRFVFDLDTAILIFMAKDNINESNLIDKSYVSFNRTIGKTTLTIEDQKVTKYKTDIKLNTIKPEMKLEVDRNTNIGALDLECFIDEDGLAKVYALGFISHKDKSSNLYYLTEFNMNSDKLILKCIDDMLVNKYNNYIFYVHNLGNYDVIFIYNVLLKVNNDKGFDYYGLKTTMRDNTIIRLDIRKKSQTNKNKYIKISLVDSLNLLNFSLDKLTKMFNDLDITKGKFPHSFVSIKNLDYIGTKPDISYYEHITTTEYQSIPLNNWSLKKECLTYLEMDIYSLYKIMSEFSRQIYINYGVQMTEALTITRLALNIFKRKFYKTAKIPSINKLYLFNFIKEGYYGGITEVYKPYGKNLVYIDVNSLYPKSALNSMPGSECTFLETFEDKGLDLENLFGFFYAKVETNNSYIGLLPLHNKDQLILPNGVFYGIWSSEELKFAKSKGYKITVFKGYNFNKIENVFESYVTELFNKKKVSEGFNRTINKSLLNNFIGRFGLSIVKPVTETVSREKRDYIFSTRIVHSQIILNNNKFLITYEPTISKEICLQHGLDSIKVLENESKKNIESKLDIFKDVSIVTGAMVTSYARISINKIKLEILEKGGSIYYSDTDSLVLDKDFLNPNWISNELGDFKLEYNIKEAYFISNKTYCLILINGDVIIKTKGVINSSLTVEDFKNMYLNRKNVTATKYLTTKNFTNASVLIQKKDVILSYDSYTKRTKIFNKDGVWIDTLPLVVNTETPVSK